MIDPEKYVWVKDNSSGRKVRFLGIVVNESQHLEAQSEKSRKMAFIRDHNSSTDFVIPFDQFE